MRGCVGATCCARWREIGRAYSEGRKEEAANEATRMLATGEHAGCRVGARVVAMLAREGALQPSFNK